MEVIEENIGAKAQTPIKKRKNYFQKDILEETKQLCLKKDAQISQSQFDQMLNKILSKINSWELFDDQQIQKALFNIPILLNQEIFAFLKEQLFSHQPSVSNSDTELTPQDQQKNNFSEIALSMIISLLQYDQLMPKSYIPKITKERQALRFKAIEQGYLKLLIKSMLQGIFEQEIKHQVLSQISIKDLQTQVDIITKEQNCSSDISLASDQVRTSEEKTMKPEEEYMIQLLTKLKNDQEEQLIKQQQYKQKQAEEEQKLRKQFEEEREQQRKQAEEMFFKRIEEKKRKRAEEAKKQMIEQQNIQKEVDEKKKAQLDKIKKKQQRQKSLKNQYQNRKSIAAINEVSDFKYHTEILQTPKENNSSKQDMKEPNTMGSGPFKMSLAGIRKKKNSSINKDIVDLSSLMDNLIVFTQQKLIDSHRLEESPLKSKCMAGIPIQTLTSYDFHPPQLTNPKHKKLLTTLQTNSPGTFNLASQGKNMLKDFRLSKDKPDIPQNTLAKMFQNNGDYQSIIMNNHPLIGSIHGGSTSVTQPITPNIHSQKASILKLSTTSDKKFSKNQMVLPALSNNANVGCNDYENGMNTYAGINSSNDQGEMLQTQVLLNQLREPQSIKNGQKNYFGKRANSKVLVNKPQQLLQQDILYSGGSINITSLVTSKQQRRLSPIVVIGSPERIAVDMSREESSIQKSKNGTPTTNNAISEVIKQMLNSRRAKNTVL